MAKGNMFLGMSRGSVGDVTFYRNRGSQIARARNRKPMNPKTEAQVIQRMILATASKAYSRMKGIVDHSFQGVQYGGVSQSYFLKRAMEDIRTFVSANYPVAVETNLFNFRGLAEPKAYTMAGVGLLVSEGTLPTINAVLTAEENPEFDHFGSSTVLEPTVSDVLTALGGVVGDQLTIIGIASNGQFYASRYVINADATTAQLAESWDGTADGEAFDPVKSSVGTLNISVSDGKIIPAIGGGLSVIAASIILSRKDGANWLRSTQRLIPIGDNIATLLVENGPDVVIPMWQAGTAVIETANPYFLNNAEE